jgi:hypothetical protein
LDDTLASGEWVHVGDLSRKWEMGMYGAPPTVFAVGGRESLLDEGLRFFMSFDCDGMFGLLPFLFKKPKIPPLWFCACFLDFVMLIGLVSRGDVDRKKVARSAVESVNASARRFSMLFTEPAKRGVRRGREEVEERETGSEREMAF